MKKIAIYIVALVLLVSCKRNLKDVSWDVEAIAPLLTSSLTIEDLIKDDSNFVKSGKEISFVYKQSIEPIGLKIDTLITLGVEDFLKTVKLETLTLPEQRISDTVFLRDVGPGIGVGDGSSFPAFFFNVLPATSLPSQEVDFSQFLTSATLTSGDLKLEIENQLDVVIETMVLKVSNKGDGYVIINDTLKNVQHGETRSINKDLVQELNGNPIEGKLNVEIPYIKFTSKPGVTQVFIDYDNFVRFDMSITDVQVSEATAVFQAQKVIDNPDTSSLSGMGDVILTGALIDTAIIQVKASNTVDAILDFTYDLTGAIKDGQPFSINETLPAKGSINKPYPFYGYYLYLKGNPAPGSEIIRNTFYSEIVGFIRETTNQVNLSLSDSIDIKLGFDKIKAKYVEGYLGSDTFGFKTSVAVDAWDDFPLEDVDFKTIDLNLFLENGLGVPGRLTIKELKAKNSKTGETKSITTIVKDIARADEVNKKLNPVETEIQIAGATDLINIKPDSLVLDFEIITNPGGNDGSYSNFLERVSYVRPSARIEIPFELNTKGFSLKDTVDFDVNDFQVPDLLRDEKLMMIIDNNIPASGTVKATFLNASGGIIDEIVTAKQFVSPSVNAEGEAIEVKRSSYVFEMPKTRLEKIVKAKKVVYTVNFSTSTMIDFVKILSDNSLKVTLIGDAGIHIETKEF